MKQGGLICVSLVLLLCFCCVPVFGQPNANSVETFEVDNFDTPDDVEWNWHVQTSRYIADSFPRMGYFNGIPNSLRPKVKSDSPDPMVLGIEASFNRKGDNWLEIIPVNKETDENGEAVIHEIPLEGTVSQIDFWVWGANYKYYLEILVRDSDGRVHVLKAGNLAFSGWKNVIVNIPSSLRQRSRLRSGPRTMSFVGFRIRTDPAEYVDEFKVYLDQIRYTSNLLDVIYDGFDLNDVVFESASDDVNNNSDQDVNDNSDQTDNNSDQAGNEGAE